eukprot:310141_1
MANKGRIGAVFGLLGLVCIIVAMLSNNISGYEYTVIFLGVHVTTKLTCRWSTFDFCVNNQCENGVEYGTWCDNSSQASADGDWCEQQRGGQSFIAMLLIILIISLVAVLTAILSHLKKVQKFVRWLFLISAILCIIAVVVWVGTSDSNNLCYDTDLDGLYWGASLILTVIACIMFVIAFALTFGAKKEGD